MTQKRWTLALAFVALMVLMGFAAAGCGGSTVTTPENEGSEPLEAIPDTGEGAESEPTQADPTTEAPPAAEPTAPAPTEEERDSDESALDGKTLLETRCTQCHDLGRVTSASKSADAWEKNVVRMVSKGANLNAEEQAVLIEYLSTTYP